MAVSNEQMQSILGRARLLCTEQADNKMNKMKTNTPSGMFNDPDPSSFDGSEFDAMYLSEGSTNMKQRSIENYGNNVNSKMPSNIRESMLTNRIGVESVLDRIDTSSIVPQKQTQELVSEERQPSYQMQSVPSQSIDYSVLRAIINECIDSKLKEYFGEKGRLNESAGLKTISLSEGNIRLVDNSDRVFKAELKYEGKLKKK